MDKKKKKDQDTNNGTQKHNIENYNLINTHSKHLK